MGHHPSSAWLREKVKKYADQTRTLNQIYSEIRNDSETEKVELTPTFSTGTIRDVIRRIINQEHDKDIGFLPEPVPQKAKPTNRQPVIRRGLKATSTVRIARGLARAETPEEKEALKPSNAMSFGSISPLEEFAHKSAKLPGEVNLSDEKQCQHDVNGEPCGAPRHRRYSPKRDPRSCIVHLVLLFEDETRQAFFNNYPDQQRDFLKRMRALGVQGDPCATPK